MFLDDDWFDTGSFGVFAWTLDGNLPRRFASSTDAVMSSSNSLSVRCLMASGRSLGRTWRCFCAGETCFVGGGEASRTDAVENRSGVAGSVRSRPMTDHARTNASKQLHDGNRTPWEKIKIIAPLFALGWEAPPGANAGMASTHLGGRLWLVVCSGENSPHGAISPRSIGGSIRSSHRATPNPQLHHNRIHLWCRITSAQGKAG